jgi:hypothetical protein
MTRPTIPKRFHRQQIALTLPPSLILRAKAFAELGKVPVSRMVEGALNDWLDKVEKELRRQHINTPS